MGPSTRAGSSANEYTAGMLFLALRLGTALLFVAVVIVESRVDPGRRLRTLRPLYATLAATLLVCGAITVAASDTHSYADIRRALQ